MNRVLVSIDGSENSMKAVAYAGSLFSCIKDLQITLLHVLPFVPAVFWDDGHILTEEERQERRKVIDKWLRNQRSMIEGVFRKAVQTLVDKGIRPEQAETRIISDSINIPESIIEEARAGGYQTILMGRRGISQAKYLLMGSVSSGVINHASGLAVCIVE